MELPTHAGDLFLVCSDGLVSMLDDPEIEEILLDPEGEPDLEATAEVLVESANKRGGVDNVTVALLAVGGEDDTGDDEEVGPSKSATPPAG